jgi:hypothetical protein
MRKMVSKPDSPRYNASLAAALRILDILGESAREPTPILLSKILFTVLEAIELVEERRGPLGFKPSAN